MSARQASTGAASGPLRRVALLSAAPLAAVVAFFGLSTSGSDSATSEEQTPTSKTATASIKRTTLAEREEVEGTLGYGKTTTVVNRGHGTITGLASVGSVVERNGMLYELDGRAVRLLYGDLPAFRRLAAGVAAGVDIAQLEGNLIELGFANGLISRPDTTWDSATTAAVKRWQKAANVEQDGVIEDGEIVFLPGAARVSSHLVEVGGGVQPGGAVVKVTGTAREVSIDLDARKQRLATQGAKVEIELSDGTTAAGTISSVATVAEREEDEGEGQGGGGGGDSKATVAVTVTLDDPAAAGSLDGAPVTVRLVAATREGVLAVPVNALLALAEGGYGVEVTNGAGRRLIRVETGLFSQGLVEVSGEGLAEGMRVVVPQ